MNRLKTRLLVTAAAIAVLGTSAQAAELVQKDDAPVTRTDSLAGLSVDSSSDSSETAETAAAEESSTEAESLAPDAQVRSKLTGRLVDAEVGTKRPMAIMLNNIYDACPQAGIEEAGIVYEAPVEGGLTRLMGIFEDYRGMEKIGSVRSCRDYYIDFAKEFDAVYIHYGQAVYAMNKLNAEGTDNISGLQYQDQAGAVSGYCGEDIFYRTSDRKAPHNAYTSGDRIDKAAQALGYSETYTENYQSDHFKFASPNNPNTLEQYGSSAIPATKINLAGAYPITKTYFEYNEEDGLYYRFQGMQKGDQKHMDGANNKQLAFKNVLVQFAYYETRDAKGYLSFQCHDDTKDGYYFTNGKGIHVTWKKTSDFAPTKFYDDNGNEIEINPGKTNICVVEQGKSIDAE